jgi:hypothetical protein
MRDEEKAVAPSRVNHFSGGPASRSIPAVKAGMVLPLAPALL